MGVDRAQDHLHTHHSGRSTDDQQPNNVGVMPTSAVDWLNSRPMSLRCGSRRRFGFESTANMATLDAAGGGDKSIIDRSNTYVDELQQQHASLRRTLTPVQRSSALIQIQRFASTKRRSIRRLARVDTTSTDRSIQLPNIPPVSSLIDRDNRQM